jgi:dolichyl-phosphate-mannose--protein O-mannosyl transferase
LVAYHLKSYVFHTGPIESHSYESNPALWLLQQRPTLFLYESEPTCGAETCAQSVIALGNPLIWWFGAGALVLVLYNAIVWADRRAWAITMGYVGGYLPWLFYSSRTIFTFYTAAFVPFVVLALTYAAGRLIGPAGRHVPGPRDALGGFGGWNTGLVGGEDVLDSPKSSRGVWTVAVMVLLGLILLVSAFFWPIWSGQSVPQPFWKLHMWLPSWF